MKRVLSLVLALVLVLGMIPTFAADMTAGQHLFEHEFIAGDGNGNLMEDQLLTREQLAKLILELNGSKEEAEALTLPPSFTDSAKISAWARPYVAYAQIEGLMVGYNDGSFRPQEGVSGQMLAQVLTRALGYEFAWGTVVADAAGLGIDVATGAALTRGEAFEAMWVTVNTKVKDSENTLGAILGKLGPVIPAKVEIASAAMAGIKKLDVTFNKAVDTTKAVVKVKKGAAIYSGTVTWNEAKTVASVATVIALPAGDYTVEVTGLDEVLTKTVTVIAEAAAKIEVSSTTLDDNTAAAKINFAVKNQYGEDMGKLANTAGLVVSGYNVTQNKTVTVVAGANKYFTVDTTAPDANEFKVGDNVRVIVSYAGLTAQANLTVQNPAAAATISLGELVLAKDDVRLNVADATVKMNYVLLDQYGNAIKLPASANLAAIQAAGVNLISSNTAVISGFATNADKELVLTIAGDGTATITAVVNATGSVASTQVVVAKNGTATTASVSAPTVLVAGGDKAFDLTLSILDQYGDVVKSNAGLTATLLSPNAEIAGMSPMTISAKADKVTVDPSGLTVTATRTATVEIKNGTTVIGTLQFSVEPNAVATSVTAVKAKTTFENAATYTFKNSDFTVLDQYGRAFSGTAVVTEKTDASSIISLAGNAATFHATNVGTATLTVTVDAGPTLDFTVKAIASADVVSYTLAYADPIYADNSGDYDVTPVLSGKLADGTDVVLKAGKVTVLTTSNPSIATIVGSGLKVQGVDAGTAEISAWSGATKLASTTVTVSKAAPVPASVKFDTTVVVDASDATNLRTAGYLVVTDQYGVDITATAVGTWVTSDVAVVNASGVATGAGTATVSFITNNGLVVTGDVVVQP